MNLKEDDYIINGLLVYSEGDTPITLVTQRGAVKRMLAQEISPLSRAKRGIMVIRELKKNPHRLVYLKESESDDEMILLTQKGTSKHTVKSLDYPISDRTSNGSFALDESKEGTVVRVHAQQRLFDLLDSHSSETNNG